MTEGWVAQLSDDLKGNEAFDPYRDGTISDFAQGHLDTLGRVSELDGRATEAEGKVGDLEGRLANAIPKLDENATEEEKLAFYRTLGMPENAADYEFPVIEGQEPDQQMIEWAQKTFHTARLNKEQASVIGDSWNVFVAAMDKAHEEAAEVGKQKALDALMTEAGGSDEKYKELVGLSQRLWKDATGSEMDQFLHESGVGYDPRFIQVMLYFAKKTGEDKTLQAAQHSTKDPKEALLYDKSPAPPQNQ